MPPYSYLVFSAGPGYIRRFCCCLKRDGAQELGDSHQFLPKLDLGCSIPSPGIRKMRHRNDSNFVGNIRRHHGRIYMVKTASICQSISKTSWAYVLKKKSASIIELFDFSYVSLSHTSSSNQTSNQDKAFNHYTNNADGDDERYLLHIGCNVAYLLSYVFVSLGKKGKLKYSGCKVCVG